MSECLGISIKAAKKILKRAELPYYYRTLHTIRANDRKGAYIMQFRERGKKNKRSVLEGGSDLRNIHDLAECTNRLLLVTAIIESKGGEFYSRWVNPATATNKQISRIPCYEGAVGLEENVVNMKHIEKPPRNQSVLPLVIKE